MTCLGITISPSTPSPPSNLFEQYLVWPTDPNDTLCAQQESVLELIRPKSIVARSLALGVQGMALKLPGEGLI